MTNIIENWFEIISILSAAALGSLWIGQLRARARRRTHDLETTRAALNAHYDAVSVIMDEPAFPLDAKLSLAALTEALSHREIAERLASQFREGSLFKNKPPRPGFQDKIEKLAISRPDLAKEYQKAIITGMYALFFRWPGTASIFQDIVLEMATDTRKANVVTGRISDLSKKLRDKDNDSNHHLPGGFAAAC